MTKHLGLVLLVACLPACRGTGKSVAPDGRDFPHVADSIDRHAPAMEDLLAFTYDGTDAGTVRLDNGLWRADGPAGDPNVHEVELLKDFRVTGDITGNGTDEAVMLLESRHPPAASRTYLTVVGWIGGQLVNLATTPIGDGIRLRGGRVEPGHIILDGVRSGPAGAAALPVTLDYALEGTTLRLVSGGQGNAPAAAAATPESSLSGTSWTLVQFQSMDDTTLKPEPGATYALSFEGSGTLQVQADCNRGRGSWKSADAGSLEMGPLAMTRAQCQSKIYDRFVRDLGDIRSYVVRDGRLHLSLKMDAGIYEFAPGDVLK